MSAFAPQKAIVRSMRKTTSSDIQSFLDDVAHSPERSTLFWWLSEHHDALIVAAAGRRIRWIAHIPRLAALGLSDGEGKPVTPRTASDTWSEVKRDIARLRAAKAAQARDLQPSRLPVTWKPTPVEPTPARAISRPAHPINTDSAPAAPFDMSEAGKARMASLDRQLNWRDRFVIPLKDKD